MNIDQAAKTIFLNLARILQFANLGKYDHAMQFEEIEHLKAVLSKILSFEEAFLNAKSEEEKLTLFRVIEPYKQYSIRDFITLPLDEIK